MSVMRPAWTRKGRRVPRFGLPPFSARMKDRLRTLVSLLAFLLVSNPANPEHWSAEEEESVVLWHAVSGLQATRLLRVWLLLWGASLQRLLD